MPQYVFLVGHSNHVKMVNLQNPRWRMATIWKPLYHNISAMDWPIAGQYGIMSTFAQQTLLCHLYTVLTILRNKTEEIIKTTTGFSFISV